MAVLAPADVEADVVLVPVAPVVPVLVDAVAFDLLLPLPPLLKDLTVEAAVVLILVALVVPAVACDPDPDSTSGTVVGPLPFFTASVVVVVVVVVTTLVEDFRTL